MTKTPRQDYLDYRCFARQYVQPTNPDRRLRFNRQPDRDADLVELLKHTADALSWRGIDAAEILREKNKKMLD